MSKIKKFGVIAFVLVMLFFVSVGYLNAQTYQYVDIKYNPTQPTFLMPLKIDSNGNSLAFLPTNNGPSQPSPDHGDVEIYINPKTGNQPDARHNTITKTNIVYNRYTIDFPIEQGTPILAVADGKIVLSGCDAVSVDVNGKCENNLGYGYVVTIKHSDNSKTIYAHMMSQPIVVEGQNVVQGQILGYVGKTGLAFANHLHFEYRAENTDQWYWAKFEDCGGCVPDVGYKYQSQNTPNWGRYAYEYNGKVSFEQVVAPNQVYNIDIPIKNAGTEAWNQATIMLGTDNIPTDYCHPPLTNCNRDHTSPMYNSDDKYWLSANRIKLFGDNVAPGETAFFDFSIKAPSQPGIYSEFFRPMKPDPDGQWITSGPPTGNASPAWIKIGVCQQDYDPSQTTYCDVLKTDTFYKEIEGISKPSDGSFPLTTGCSSTFRNSGFPFFCTNNYITRVEEGIWDARWLYQMPINGDVGQLPPATFIKKVFPDINADQSEEQLRAFQLLFLDGVFRGDNSGRLLLKDNMTRSSKVISIMKLLMNHSDISLENLSNPFSDIKPQQDGTYTFNDKLILKAAELGIISSTPADGMFHGSANVTRGESAKIDYNALLVESSQIEALRDGIRVQEPKTGTICFTGSKEADERLRAKGLPYMGIFTDEQDGMEVCYCFADSIYSTNGCQDNLTKVTPSTNQDFDFEDNQGQVLKISIPEGSVNADIDLRYMEVISLTFNHSGLMYAGRSFKIEAYRGDYLTNFTFEKPINLTFNYSDADVQGIDENQLRLFYWDHTKQKWLESACGDYVRDTEKNTVTVPICHLSQFGLFEDTNSAQPECKLYAVYDQDDANSQFFSINLAKLSPEISAFGPMYKNADIEAMDIDPVNKKVYVVKSQTESGISELYQLSPQSGELSYIGQIKTQEGGGFGQVDSLSFTKDGELWGFAKEGTHGKKGLIFINKRNGIAELVLQSNVPVEGISWDTENTKLWLVKNNKDIFTFTPGEEKLEFEFNLKFLPVAKVEALEFSPSGHMLIGTHNSKSFSIYALDTQTRQIISTSSINTEEFDDVESLAWPEWCVNEFPTPEYVTPDEDNYIEFTNHGGHKFIIEIPANAINEVMHILHNVIQNTDIVAPFDWFSANKAFKLNAFKDGQLQEHFTFNKPVTLRIYYAEEDVRGINESTLTLKYWDGSEWIDELCGDVVVDTTEHVLTTQVCHFSDYAMFGKAQEVFTIYLPIVQK